MSATGSGHRRSGSPRQTVVTVLVAFVIFALLATAPLTLAALHVHIRPQAAVTSHGVRLQPAPQAPKAVALPAVATPIDPGQQPALPPTGNPAREAALVSSEDARIRVLLHSAVRIYQPEVLPVRGSLPTLVLPAGPHPYTAADLARYGALVMLKHHAALLLDNVFVTTNAKLNLGSAALRVLYLDSSTDGFTSIVAWGGDLNFAGTASSPMTILGWDRVAKTPATDRGYGRSYIREVGGKMTLANVRVSHLGFWSGRTGGVAWTGVSGTPSTGWASHSTFTSDTYGAFVDRGQNVAFTADLFEFNELDGLHIHRYSVGTSVQHSSAARNGGNGFLVDRATSSTLLHADVADHNAGNGFLIDGRPLVSGASASGSAIAPGSGAKVEASAAMHNVRTGILVEGGTGTVLTGNEVCTHQTGIAARLATRNLVVTGNDVRCQPRSGLSIGPAAPGAVISGNSVNGARIGILVRSSGHVEVDNNRLTNETVFGITARGASSVVTGVGNTISGTGFRAVDARADASEPVLTGTNTSGWQHHASVTFFTYLEFHPLAALWLSIVVLVLLCYAWSRRKRMPPHPYPASTRWRPAGVAGAGLVRDPYATSAPDLALSSRPVTVSNGDRPEGTLPMRQVVD
jgi:parallel beta helix pectate lyase-like protein